MANTNKILVIKLGALGDFIISLGAMRAIKKHHPHAHITLLTTKPFKSFAEQSNYFDEIWIDEKPKFYQLSKWRALKHKLNTANFSRVYDLQNNDRTSLYFKLLSNKKTEWVGAAKRASHHYDAPERTAGLPLTGLKLLLGHAGLSDVTVDTMDWIKTDIDRFNLTSPYALIVAGSAPSRPEKRWDAQNYADLCNALVAKNIQPVLIGTQDEKDITDTIHQLCPDCVNLSTQTSLFDIITLGRHAQYAIGNDTGPMHMVAPTGCNTLVLFSRHSNPTRNAPMGKNVQTIQVNDFSDLSVKDVQHKLFN